MVITMSILLDNTLSHPTQWIPNNTSEDPVAPIRAKKTAHYTPFTAAFLLIWFWKVEIMYPWPKFIPICILLSYPFQGTLNHTSGDPVAPIRGKKKHLLPVTQLHFPVHCSEWLKSGCNSLNSYFYPPLLLSLPNSSPRTLNQTLGTQWPPLMPRKSPETTQNTSYFVKFCQVYF